MQVSSQTAFTVNKRLIQVYIPYAIEKGTCPETHIHRLWPVGYHWNCLVPFLMAGPKLLMTELGCVGDLCSVKFFEKKTNYKLQHTLDEASLRLAGHWLFINVVQPNGVYEYTLNQILLLFAP